MKSNLLDEDRIMQICFVTHDIEASSAWFAEVVGREPSTPTIEFGGPNHTPARYKDHSATPSCKLRFFTFGNVEVEFIEPGPERSAWRDLLEARGPGFHHIAFKTRNLSEHKAYLASKGYPLLQQGEFEGGRYAYFDTVTELGAMIELLENDTDKE